MANKFSRYDILDFVYSVVFIGGLLWLIFQIYKIYSENPEVDETWIETVGTNLRPHSGKNSVNLFVFNMYDSTLKISRTQEAFTSITSYNNAKGEKYIIKYYPKDPSYIYVLEYRPVFLSSEIEKNEVFITKAIISRKPYQANISFNQKNKIYELEYSYVINKKNITKIQELPKYLNKDTLNKGDTFDVWVWRKNSKRAILILEDEDKYIYYDK